MYTYKLALAVISSAMLFGCGGGNQEGPLQSIVVESDLAAPPTINSKAYLGSNSDVVHKYSVAGAESTKALATIGGINYVAPEINETNALDYVVLRGEVNSNGGKCYDSRRDSNSAPMVRGVFLPCIPGKNEQLIKLVDRGETSGGNSLYQLAINAGQLCIQPNGPLPLTEGLAVVAGNCGRSDNADVWIEHEDGLTRSAIDTNFCLKAINDQLFVVGCDLADAQQHLSFSNYMEEIGLMYKAWGGYCLSTGTSPNNLRGTYVLASCNEYDQAQRIGANEITTPGRPVLQGGYFGQRCMAAAGGSLSAGNYLANGELCDGSSTRSWYFDDQGKLRSPDTGLCGGVEGANPTAGSRIILQPCQDTPAQQFVEFLPNGPSD